MKNPLSSPYILGVSAGASFGAVLVILTGFTLPIKGFGDENLKETYGLDIKNFMIESLEKWRESE